MPDQLFEIHDDQINVDEIMSRIQERARQRTLQGPIPSGATAPRTASLLPAAAYPSGDEVRNLEILNANFDPESTLPERTRLRGLKRLVFWAVRAFARAQASFNAAATALLSKQVDQISAVVQCLSALEERVGGLDELRGVMDNRVTDLEKALDGLCAGLAGREVGPDGRVACLKAAAAELHELEDHERALGQRHELLRQEVLLQKRRLELILREVRRKMGLDRETASRFREQEERLSDHLFVLHDQTFRGTDEEIRQRMAIYMPVLAERRAQVGEDAYVLDIGCGRGALLELLREAGIPARGVEQNEEAAQVCRDKGLTVAQRDGLAELASLPDESLLGVTALHVVEHLALPDLLEFIKLCHQKIRRGGALVLETPNPTNLVVGAAEFYLDLTHRRPIHPLALSHLVESLGFVDVELRNLQPAEPELLLRLTSGSTGDLATENENWRRLNDLLFGPRDYAVIATR